MTTTTTNDAAQRERLIDLIATRLSGTYHCNRVWAAWSVGTMSEDDFSDVGESDTPAELADAILALLGQRATAEQSSVDQRAAPAAVAVPSEQDEWSAVEQAAEILENEAEVIRECHAPRGDWAGEPEAKADYDKFLSVAAELRRLLVVAPQPQVAAPAAVAVPDGWRLVPVRPTPEWIGAVADDGYADCNVAQLIASILSHAPDFVAAPQPPVAAQEPVVCWCLTCRPLSITDMRMALCPTCGNKRCPKANDHRNACTGSNDPGQPGSAYSVTREALAEQPRPTPPAGADDPLYPKAVLLVRDRNRASVGLLKRALGVGGIRAELMLSAMVGTVIDKAAPFGRVLPAADTGRAMP